MPSRGPDNKLMITFTCFEAETHLKDPGQRRQEFDAADLNYLAVPVVLSR